ncbi:NUDIX domain-containing protein [Sulfitobacter sabulilitoris]|uniref:NUDIX hydrolase n=1 Tax=Sulfitobacter sabulilitoris TaxID=2562655 RepID=A0A5S3PM45_9RHOB|nr:NUDIX hydrolase [Sulfitobacter sabulilitoris]TMM55453.1 NUDIX hydrolase [Sulfitobacter sabulilitoris]
MPVKSPRIAVRAIIVHEERLLLVNAWPKGRSSLLCAPGGGAEPGASLPQNLAREVHEETGLTISVGLPCLINEFHDPRSGFHQIEVFFRCALTGSATISPDWKDPEHVVTEHHWVTRADMARLNVKPDALSDVAFNLDAALRYDPLEAVAH